MAKSRWFENDDAMIRMIKDKRNAARSYLIEVVNGATTGGQRLSQGTASSAQIKYKDKIGIVIEDGVVISHADPRSARDNARIRWVQQRKFGRNPWFLYAKEVRPIKSQLDKWAWIPSRLELSAIADGIGQDLAQIFKGHIRQKKTKGGKPMPPNTKRWMRRKYQATGRRLPPLIYTGQLIKSIVSRTKEV